MAADNLGGGDRFPTALAGTAPGALSATIDTGRLSWDDSLAPDASEFTGYGVEIGDAEVLFVDDSPLARLPMITTAGDSRHPVGS